jgi:protein required for attachment to host cells
MRTWIVVADASRADVFAHVDEDETWLVVDRLEHHESRLKSVEISPTDPGHAAKSKGSPRRTSLDPKMSPHEVEKKHFADELCQYLDHQAANREYERLWVFAPPHFLGMLRKGMSTEVQRRLSGSVAHDYHFGSAREAQEELKPWVEV